MFSGMEIYESFLGQVWNLQEARHQEAYKHHIILDKHDIYTHKENKLGEREDDIYLLRVRSHFILTFSSDQHQRAHSFCGKPLKHRRQMILTTMPDAASQEAPYRRNTQTARRRESAFTRIIVQHGYGPR